MALFRRRHFAGEAAWRALLDDLIARGLKTPLLEAGGAVDDQELSAMAGGADTALHRVALTCWVAEE